MLEKMFEQRYGQTLLSMLSQKLSGGDLQQAITVLERGNSGFAGMPKFVGE
jgi:hypothetical protein